MLATVSHEPESEETEVSVGAFNETVEIATEQETSEELNETSAETAQGTTQPEEVSIAIYFYKYLKISEQHIEVV